MGGWNPKGTKTSKKEIGHLRILNMVGCQLVHFAKKGLYIIFRQNSQEMGNNTPNGETKE